MKSTELRIGNLVNFTFMELTEQYTVHEIRANSVLITPDISYELSMVSGIPLTEQWLLDLGFEDLGGYWQIKNNWFDVEYINDSFWFTTHGDDVRIQYVHQLQNLYHSLTGQELTLNK